MWGESVGRGSRRFLPRGWKPEKVWGGFKGEGAVPVGSANL